MSPPTLTRTGARSDAAGVLLVLHGGTAHSVAPVDGRSLSWRRARVLQRALARRSAADGTAVWLLRYRQRGWNDPTAPSPVPDARWALAEVRREHGPVPVVLVGHSMGARTAVRVADDPAVTGVVALAPWFPPDEPVAALAGRRLAVAHGRADRITSYRSAREYVERARRVARSATFQDMGPVGHYLLRDVARWNDFTAGQALGMLRPG